eukprot:9762017-Alexandrium_andersonii.AAC.1
MDDWRRISQSPGLRVNPPGVSSFVVQLQQSAWVWKSPLAKILPSLPSNDAPRRRVRSAWRR